MVKSAKRIDGLKAEMKMRQEEASELVVENRLLREHRRPLTKRASPDDYKPLPGLEEACRKYLR